MATIGNSLAPYFTATTSDVFSANGTGTDFTLTRSISNLVDIEVLVNNIQQNPFNGAYSVNGNTLTFSEAPSAGANNVLVSYRQAVIGSTIPTPNTVASSSLQRDLTLGGNTTSNGTMFTQALVPTANVTYDIGTSTLRYKDIYLSGTTIKLGDVSLSASGNTFTVANSTGGTLPSSMGNTTIAGTANVTGDMTIGGNLTVTGTMTYINTTDLNIGDAIISLNADLAANIAPTEDAGISINRGASTNAQFKWIESTDNWSLGNTTVSGILTSNDHVITGTANVSTGINVGANVNLSTSQINVGNSTVNTVITSASLSTNGVTITGGTANSIAYLNVSKVVTTGSALTFDGTHLGVGGLYSGYGANYPTIQAKGTYGGIFRSSDAAGNTVSLFYSSSGNYLTLGTETNYPIQFIVNNSERMRLNTSGNLGLGVSPSAWGGSSAVAIELQSYGAALYTNGAGSTSTNLSHGTYYNGTNWIQKATDVTGARYQMTGSSLGSAHAWFVAPNSTAGANISFTQAMTLDASGNLGVGTSSPLQRLDVASSSTDVFQTIRSTSSNTTNVALRIQDGTTGTTGGDGIYLGRAGAVNYLWTYENEPWVFATNNTERMRIDSSGNLGLGVTPSASTLYYRTLQIGGSAKFSIFGQRVGGACETFVGWNAYGGSNTSTVGTGFYYVNTGDSATMYSQNAQHAWFIAPSGTAGANISFTQAMTLAANGNLGVGTTSPLEKLMVSGPGVFTGQLQDLRASSMVVDYQSGIGGRIISTGPDASTHAPIAFATTTTTTYAERMRIDSAGNVGIGTTTPSTGKFSDAAYAFLIQSASTTNGTNLFASNSDNSKFVGFWSGHSSAEPAVGVKTGNALTFGKWGTINGTGGFTENMRISSDGVLQVGRTNGTAPDGKLQVIASGTGAGTAGTKLGFTLIEDDSGNAAGLWLGSMTTENTGVIGSRTASGNIGFQTYNGGWAERVRITYDGSFKITQSPGKYSVDVSGGGTVIANGGTVDFPYASGMLVVNNWNNGAVSIYLCGSGNVQLVSSVTTQVGTFAYNAGIAGYTWTNNSGVTNAHGFFFVRTRPTA